MVNEAGFTLLELIIVTLSIVILFALVLIFH
jgi:type II secretory pathway pseudopilin PulG